MSKIGTLTQKRDELNEQIKKLKARESTKRRKEDTKRKILLALGLKVTDKDRVFGAPGTLDQGLAAHSEGPTEEVRQY